MPMPDRVCIQQAIFIVTIRGHTRSINGNKHSYRQRLARKVCVTVCFPHLHSKSAKSAALSSLPAALSNLARSWVMMMMMMIKREIKRLTRRTDSDTPTLSRISRLSPMVCCVFHRILNKKTVKRLLIAGSSSNAELSEYQPYTSYVIFTPNTYYQPT